MTLEPMKMLAQLGTAHSAVFSWRWDVSAQREEEISFTLPLQPGWLSTVRASSTTDRKHRRPPP